MLSGTTGTTSSTRYLMGESENDNGQRTSYNVYFEVLDYILCPAFFVNLESLIVTGCMSMLLASQQYYQYTPPHFVHPILHNIQTLSL